MTTLEQAPPFRSAGPDRGRDGHRSTGGGREAAARALIWNLQIGGWSEREAGNLVGLLHGLRPAQTGWTEREIDHLRFLRSIVESGRLVS